MLIRVRLLAHYRRLAADACEEAGGLARDCPPGTRVGDLLRTLPIPAADLPTFFVNGRHAEREQVLEDGDEVAVFPAAGGG